MNDFTKAYLAKKQELEKRTPARQPATLPMPGRGVPTVDLTGDTLTPQSLPVVERKPDRVLTLPRPDSRSGAEKAEMRAEVSARKLAPLPGGKLTGTAATAAAQSGPLPQTQTGPLPAPSGAEAISRQHEAYNAELKELEQKIREAEIVQYYPEAFASAEPVDREALDALRARRDRVKQERDALAAGYFIAAGQEAFTRLESDSAAKAQYDSAEEIQADIKKVLAVAGDATSHTGEPAIQEYKDYLARKYGLTQKDIDNYTIGGAGYLPGGAQEGYGNLWRLYEELERRKGEASAALGRYGYDYGRMTTYREKMEAEEEARQAQEQTRKATQEHPILSSAASVLAAPLQWLEYLKVAGAQLTGTNDPSNLEKYVPLGASTLPLTGTVQTIRGTVAQGLEESTDLEIGGQNVAAFLYNTGMSIADSAVLIASLGPVANYFMAGNAAAAASLDIVQRGGTGEQAFWGGLAAGAAEAIFEKVSIDKLLSAKSIGSVKDLLGEVAKQAGVEASEESFTEIANILSDAAIMGEKSHFNMAVESYLSQGMSREEARQKAFLDNVAQVAWAGVGGGLSGGMMGGMVNSANYLSQGGRLLPVRTGRADAMESVNERLAQPGQVGQDLDRRNAAVTEQAQPLLTVEEQQKTASTGEAGDFYFDAADTNNSWKDRMYTQGTRTFIQSQDRQRMYEVPKQADIQFRVSEDGMVTLEDDIVSQLDKSDYRDFIKAYAELNLVSKYAEDAQTIINRKPITVRSTGDTILITQTGINDVAKKIRGAGIKNQDNVSSILLLDKLIENSVPTVTAENTHQPGLNPFTYYSGKFSVDGRNYNVTLHIKNVPEGDRYYYHTLDKIEVAPTYGNPANSETYQEMGTTSSDTTVPQGAPGVKGQDAPEGGRVFPPGSGLDGGSARRYDGAKEASSDVGGEKGAVDLRAVYGGDVRGEAQGADPGRVGTYSGTDTEIHGKEADWARGHVVERPLNQAVVRASEQARSFIPDVLIVEDAALKAVHPEAWGVTSNGVVYLSDAVPGELSDVVGHHEVVHAVKQRGNVAYQSFVDTVGGLLNLQSPNTKIVLQAVLESRFGEEKSLLDLNERELHTAFDELNAVVWGFHKADPENARAQFSGVFTDYDGYIAELDAIMEGAKGALQSPQDGAPGAAGQTGSPDGTGPESSVGASRAGFDPYSHMQNQYGTIKPGENPARTVDVPRQTTDADKVSRTARTAMEAAATPDSAVADLGQAVVDDRLSYIPIENSATTAKAEAAIRDKGFTEALRGWTADVRGGKTSADITAMGAQLYNAAVNGGDTKLALDILADYAKNIREGAQAVQAARILKTLTPSGQLYMIQRSVQNIQEEVNRKFGEGKHHITIDPALADGYLKAADEQTRSEALDAIYQNVAGQIPADWVEKWNAWRYLAMLGNPRTHIRNIAGNAGFVPVRMMKDIAAMGIEAAMDKVLPGGIERTKAPLNPASESDRALIKAAWLDAAAMEEQILGQGKFSEGAAGKIEQGRTIFKTLPLEAARKFNSKALDVEDTWFSRPAYAGALAGWLKANNVTLETADAATLDRARAYAVREAQRATYRDANAFSDFVAGLHYRGNNPVGKAANTLMEGVLPFRRTPANILVRGVEYSPAGLLKGLTYDLYQVKAGKISAAEAIDNISAGLVGLGLTALGALLASMGLVSGGGEDEQDDLTGGQPYALTIGDKNYTLDWLAPEALPFFVGVELWNATGAEGTGRTADDIFQAIGSISEPMLEMSMLQSLQDTIDSVSYSDNKIMGLLSTAATGYLTQAFPTLFGQLERIGEGERQSTFIDRTSPLSNDMQYTLGRVMNKLPGEFQQIPYIDAWGRREESGTAGERVVGNLLAPWYTSKENTTRADEEVQRLHDGGYGVLPKRAAQSDKVDGAYLDAEEYVTYAETKGQLSHELVGAMLGSDAYKRLSDEQKADAISLAYAYAKNVAAAEVTDGRHESDAYVALARAAKRELGLSEAEYLLLYREYGGNLVNGKSVRAAYREGMDPEDYLSYAVGRSGYNGDGKGDLTIAENAKAIAGSGLPKDQQEILWLLTYPKWAEKAAAAGLSNAEYIEYKALTAGYSKKGDIMKALQAAGKAYPEAARLWELIDGK